MEMQSMTDFTMIDMEHYPRLEHFRYFSSMPDPKLGITVKVDVSRLAEFCREKNFSFYLAMTHTACLAANRVPELRQRRRGGGIIEYSECGTSHIELLPDSSYCYCTLRHGMSWDEFIPYAKACREKAVASPGIAEEEDADSLFFVSSLPWLHYEQVSMPVSGNAADNPHLCWGRYEEDSRGRLMIPFTLYANHALADGIHFAAFFRILQEELDKVGEET